MYVWKEGRDGYIDGGKEKVFQQPDGFPDER